MNSAPSSWAWDLYWHADRLESCVATQGHEAAQALRQVWCDWLSRLPDRTRLLDIGSGNGALSALAAEISQSATKDFDLHAIDAAAIDPHRFASSNAARLRQVTFLGGVLMQDMPFRDGFFDAAMAQYAIEYAPLDPSIREIARILRSGGPFRFLVHGAGSVLASRSRDELAGLEAISSSDILPLMKRYLPDLARALGEGVQTSTDTAAGLDTLRQTSERLAGLAIAPAGRAIIGRFLKDAAQLFTRSPELGETGTREAIEGMALQVRAQSTRLHDLLAAARDEPGIEGMRARMAQCGLAIDACQRALVGATRVEIGWWLEGFKS